MPSLRMRYAACSERDALPSGKLTLGFMVPPASQNTITPFLPASAARVCSKNLGLGSTGSTPLDL
jgi:hypothetical protein